MSSLIFKQFIGDRNRGDLIWTHPSQKQFLLLDGVSSSLPEKAVKLCEQWLSAQPKSRLLRSEQIIEELNQLLFKNGAQAVFCLATVKKTNL